MKVVCVGSTLALLAFSAEPLRAQRIGVVRGRVVDDARRGFEGAEVTWFSGPDSVSATRSDRQGHFVLSTRELRGAVTLRIRAVGYRQLDQAIAVDATVAVLDLGDIRLAQRVELLKPVSSKAVQQLIPSAGEDPRPGTTSRSTSELRALLVDPSSLNDLVTELPGVSKRGDAASILGAAVDQNRVRVDGLDFQGARVPRDVIEDAKLLTTAFDPSIGRFAGGEVQVRTVRSGGPSRSMLRTQFSPVWLAVPDSPDRRGGRSATSVSGFATGRLFATGLSGLVAVDASVRALTLETFSNMRTSALADFGLSALARDQVISAAGAAGIPTTAQEDGGREATAAGSALARLDWSPTTRGAHSLVWLSTFSTATRGGGSPLSLRSTTVAPRSIVNRLAWSRNGYVGPLLDEIRLSFGRLAITSQPVSSIPRALLRIPTTTPDGRSGMSTIELGGSGALKSTLEVDQVAMAHESRIVLGAGVHQIKLAQEINWQRRRSASGLNAVGTYEFVSVEHLATNRPSVLERVTNNDRSEAAQLAWSASVGDVWDAAPGRLQVQSGVRVDGAHVLSRLPANPELDRLAQAILSGRLAEFYASPRLGFAWRLTGSQDKPLAPLGTTIPLATSARAMRTPIDAGGIAIPVEPSGLVLSGGLGAFQGVMPIQLLSELVEQRGLPSSRQLLRCTGSELRSQWTSAPNAWPSGCRSVATDNVSDNGSLASLLATDFHAPLSWRLHAQLSGIHAIGWGILPELTLTRGRYAESLTNLNLRSTAGILLPAEEGRPVYAETSQIDPHTGVFDLTASRVVERYTQILQRRSDLSYTLANVVIGAAPQKPLRFGRPYLVWSWTNQREQIGGLTSHTRGDQRTRQWVRAGNPEQELQAGIADVGPSWFRVSTRVRITSARSFTPLVAQDINGDGLANDRAFVFNPMMVGDSSLAQGMTALLSQLPTTTRSCLKRQVGRIAGANSCRAEWTANVNVAVTSAPASHILARRRVTLSASVANASTLLVRMFGLQRSALGRLTEGTPDPRLLFVRGFDPVTKQFVYRVNQEFGRATDASSKFGRPPFEVYLGAALSFGPDR